jgi:acetyl esterase/lipase
VSIMMSLSCRSRIVCAASLLAASPLLHAEGDPAAAFGARPDITSVRMSPDGASLVFVTPIPGQGSAVYTTSLAPGAKPKVAFYADGKPLRLKVCNWVSNERLVCVVHGVAKDEKNPAIPVAITKLMAVNADGSKPQQITIAKNPFTRNPIPTDEAVIDWSADQDGSVLVEQTYQPTSHEGLGSMIYTDLRGLGVDEIDTRTLAVKHVIKAREDAIGYISDQHGTVRIVATIDLTKRTMGGPGAPPPPPGPTTYLFRAPDSNDWQKLSTYNEADQSGFRPIAVDHDLNVAYGWKKVDGRLALYSMTLDGSAREQLVLSRPDVDVSGVVAIGARHRIVGASYVTELPHADYFADDVRTMMGSLHQALPQKPVISMVDGSADGSKLLVFAGGDTDPGAYYILDSKARSLHAFLPIRVKLQGATLAHVKAITYPAGDGTMVPGFLTAPPGVDNPHGLPAIVLPPGGADARDEWGFDWLAQFYAARGFVVLQPEFRSSSGYGDAWFEHNGFKSWNVAVGDVVAAGHWLVKQGIADPAKLGVVGWSYGGYAALQSAVVEPDLFKATIAIAPVTDLAALKEQRRAWPNFDAVNTYIGDGTVLVEGSPIKHPEKFKQPVLIFHGTGDQTVSVEQSKTMAAALKTAGGNAELVSIDDDDHDLADSAVRSDLLHRSDAFLRKSFGMAQ